MTNKKTGYYSEAEIINSTRTLSVLSAILFLSFSLIDVWAISSALTEVLIVRSIVVTCCLLSYLATFVPALYRYMNIVMPSVIIVASIGIEYMVYKATPGDHAYSVYFVGLVLILMTLYSWTYIKFYSSLLITCVVVAGYIYIEQYTRPADAMLALSELLANLFFIGSAVVIGVVARLMRDRFMHENLLLQESLSEALHVKTEEAENNAHRANHDELTGLPNRRYATELLENSLKVAKETDRVLVIMFVDLNGFKQINDVYGHATGDEVLRIVGRRLELTVRKSDCLSRIGGDEYLIGLLLDKENIAEVEHMAEKFSTIISDPMNVDGVKLKVGASVGISAYPYHGNQVGVLMDIADQKMYQVKHARGESNKFSGKNDDAVVIFPGKKRY